MHGQRFEKAVADMDTINSCSASANRANAANFLDSPARTSSEETLRARPSRAQTMPSNFAFDAINTEYDAYPSLANIAAITQSYSQTTPVTPLETQFAGYFEGISEDCEGYRPSSSSSSGVSPINSAGLDNESASAKSATKITRPPNAWILYRSSKLAEFKEHNPNMYVSKTSGTRSRAERGNRPTQANMSKAIAEMWAQEPAEVKEHYHKEAMLRSVMHAVENPGYRFNPNKGRKKSGKKEKQTKSTSPYPNPQLNLLSPMPMTLPISPDVGAYTFPAQTGGQLSVSPGHSRRTSLQVKLEQIFSQADVAQYASSASSCSDTSSWTPGLLPAFDFHYPSSADATSPHTPFSEQSEMFSSACPELTPATANFDAFTHFDFAEPSSALQGSTMPYMQVPSSAPQSDVPQIQQYPDWWALRHLKVRVDDIEGIPLEDLIRLRTSSAPQ